MAESLTKNRKSNEEIIMMIQKGLGNIKVIKIEELTEGFFNIAYLIELENERSVILKIAPPSETIIMTHEKNIMYSEVTSMKMVEEKTTCPVAKILFYDNSHTICDVDYFIMEKLEGKSFSSTLDTLSEEHKYKINYEMGIYNKKLNFICGERFGYFGQPDKQGENWFEVFKSMIRDVIYDAKRLSVDLKISEEHILELLDRDESYFEEIKIPKFVHWDLWAGNIFVSDGKITGLIDFERCLWADELMEVGFRTYEYNAQFFQGYGMDNFNNNQQIRAKWYDVYLFLIWSIEGAYRKYENNDLYNFGTDMLKKWITEFEERSIHE
ncbi:phosphotransferase [Clostridium sp. C2-6-12]|uniref:phosphotransferase family protein n=1 Tax=Clostridium sp. C2-6-12 TaxID=2698832 RepID=UPI001FAB939D|nr:phosphotransferase [Clostridium sp. C2-6-12]